MSDCGICRFYRCSESTSAAALGIAILPATICILSLTLLPWHTEAIEMFFEMVRQISPIIFLIAVQNAIEPAFEKVFPSACCV